MVEANWSASSEKVWIYWWAWVSERLWFGWLGVGFLVRAPDSRNDYVGGGGAASSFGEHASMGKGTYECDGSKEPQ